MMLSRLAKPTLLAVVAAAVVVSLLTLAYGEQASKAWPDAFPKKGIDSVPESVDKLTIAVDSWGTSDLNPWLLTSVSFLGDYFNLRLMMQDPNGDLVPALPGRAPGIAPDHPGIGGQGRLDLGLTPGSGAVKADLDL